MLLFTPGGTIFSGPSLRIQKWYGRRSHRVPKAREGGEHERGDYSPSRQGGLGGLPREFFFNLGRFYVRF